MPVSRDIVRMYRRPRAVVRDLYAMGVREDRAIAWLMIACFIMFVSSLPALQRGAVLEGSDFNQNMIYAFFSWLLLWPLVLYGIAFVAFLITRAFRANASNFGARVAVFWGLLSATPLVLFYGMLVGLNGPDHPGTTMIGILWLAVLAWFWVSGLLETSKAQ